MVQALENFVVDDGDPVRTEHIATALTAGRLVYDDDATQIFEPAGATTYVEQGQEVHAQKLHSWKNSAADHGEVLD